ncbi:unnamed protein product [Protopolystoma xenopodis]|uniref:Uncharacterized protein n=1 Tax=Protopolystoma xenopodis TaxID=117903 RepID=A0A3S4ZU61_9PLAT|nr:unnamed protein product [Protopolystoma xenopodis]
MSTSAVRTLTQYTFLPDSSLIHLGPVKCSGFLTGQTQRCTSRLPLIKLAAVVSAARIWPAGHLATAKSTMTAGSEKRGINLSVTVSNWAGESQASDPVFTRFPPVDHTFMRPPRAGQPICKPAF